MTPPGPLLPARPARPLRALAVASAVASAVLLPAALPGTAAAEEPAGTTVVGQLVQAWEETPGHEAAAEAAPAPVSWIEPASGEAVPVESDDVAGLPPGSTVAVTVDSEPAGEASAARAVLEAEVLGTPTAPAAPAGPLTNQVTVAMVAPAGTAPDPGLQLQRMVDLVDGPVAEFWAGETGGAVTVGVTASHDWIATAAGCTTPAALWDQAAAAAGFVPGPGRHLLVVLPPSAPGCAYALAEVGPSRTSGGRLYVTDDSASVIAHELGHNFGLAHSSGFQCDGTVDAGTCRTAGYRDHYDVMGVSWEQTGSLNVVQAAALGVLPDEQVQPVPVDGGAATVTLAPVSGRSGIRAARLTDPAGVDHWLEYRPAAGRDAWLGTDADPFGLDSGVLLRRAGSFPDTSVLLDGTPGSAAGWDRDLQAALVPGAPVTVAGGRFAIEVTAVTPDGAVVSVVPAPAAGAAGAVAAGPAAPAPGAVLPGGDPVPSADEPVDAPAAVPAAGQGTTVVAAPGLTAPADPAGRTRPALDTAAGEPDGVGGLLLAVGAGGALAAGSALVVQRFRRRVVR